MNKFSLLKRFDFTNVVLISIAVIFSLQWTSCNTKSNSTSAGNETSNILATPEQLYADSLSVVLLKSEAIKKVTDELYKSFLQDSLSKDPDASASAKQALDKLTLLGVQTAIAATTDKPAFLWFANAPRNWHGINLPGSQFGLDNPDNIYRIAYFDSASTYQVRIKHNGNGPIQESFDVYDATNTVPTYAKNEAFVQTKDLKAEANGEYIVTFGAAADSLTPNYIRITKPLVHVLFRNTLSDWATQTPSSIEVKKTNGATAKKITEAELITRAEKEVRQWAELILKSKNAWVYGRSKPNTLGKPNGRLGGWGFAVNGYYNLANDEAWVITLNPKAAKYVGFQLADPWLASLDYVDHSGSLNNSQAKASKDGNITYVIAASDPGVYNWLDTRKSKSGTLLIRWQVLPDSVKAIDDAIVLQKVVKLKDINTAVDADVEKLTVAQRNDVLNKRSETYKHRLN